MDDIKNNNSKIQRLNHLPMIPSGFSKLFTFFTDYVLGLWVPYRKANYGKQRTDRTNRGAWC